MDGFLNKKDSLILIRLINEDLQTPLPQIATNVLTVSTAAKADIGAYACEVDYGKYTTSTKPKSTDIDVIVRGKPHVVQSLGR